MLFNIPCCHPSFSNYHLTKLFLPGTFPVAKLVHNFFCDVLLRIVEGRGGLEVVLSVYSD